MPFHLTSVLNSNSFMLNGVFASERDATTSRYRRVREAGW